jgi:hypothetical protein
MEPEEWASLFSGQHWADREAQRNEVEREARKILQDLGDGETISTAELADRIWPEDPEASGAEVGTRKRLFSVLAKLATGAMGDCCRKSREPKEFMGKMVYGWEWHRPPPKVEPHCPHCGVELEGWKPPR